MGCFWIPKRFQKKKTKRNVSVEEDSTEWRSGWADLPDDLLLSIASHLSTWDRARMPTVCRSWRSAPYGILPAPVLSPPCLLTVSESDGRTTCFDPSCNKTYSMHFPELAGAWVMASCHGWLLLLCATRLFFFNPVTRAMHHIPPVTAMEERNRKLFRWTGLERYERGVTRAAFSAPPTSPGCVVIFADNNLWLNGVIRTWRQGSEHWSVYRPPPFMDITDTAMVLNEAIYWGKFYRGVGIMVKGLGFKIHFPQFEPRSSVGFKDFSHKDAIWFEM